MNLVIHANICMVRKVVNPIKIPFLIKLAIYYYYVTTIRQLRV